MPQSLAEAILRGLAGASQELGTELQDNQDWNLRRGDNLQRFKEEQAWRREQALRTQANADRAYNFDVDQSKQHRLDRLNDIDRKYTMDMIDREYEDRYRAKTDAERTRQFDLGYGLDLSREERLSRPSAPPKPKIDPFRKKAADVFLSNRAKDDRDLTEPQIDSARVIADPRTMYNRNTNQWAPGANAQNPYGTAQSQGDDLESWGASEYGEDWDALTPEEKIALARKNGWQ